LGGPWGHLPASAITLEGLSLLSLACKSSLRSGICQRRGLLSLACKSSSRSGVCKCGSCWSAATALHGPGPSAEGRAPKFCVPVAAHPPIMCVDTRHPSVQQGACLLPAWSSSTFFMEGCAHASTQPGWTKARPLCPYHSSDGTGL